MKFLATTQLKDTFYLLPGENQVQLREAGIAFVERCRASGKCRHVYYTGDLKGSVSVWDLQSSDELASLMAEFPQLPFTDIYTQPLIEFEAGLRAMREARERMYARV
jgi:muconolactone delta-isomerase